MRKTYSLYEAKTKLSAIVRQVRDGHSVIVTVHGKPSVEICPLEPTSSTLEDRLHELTELGVLVPPAAPLASHRPAPRRSGALDRFLADRD